MVRSGPALLGIALMLGGCSTRFIDLAVPSDGGAGGGPVLDVAAMPKCELVKRADGTECKICYAADGTLVDGACMPVAGTPASPSDALAAVACKVVPMADTRCLYCAAGPNDYTACLKCEAPIKTGATGEVCRACVWSDQMPDPINRCLQCFGADGTATQDDCDGLRKEMFTATVIPPSK